ncbi:hypothetical protein [Novosphingobium profundi]|uniref:hypothetical protein n=1 Tax=Novosphingobium profundi TaxID=1774954 RepID=UPI001CFF4EC2|nr:hypothetical protein [Novosphingobium profundi]
MNETIKAVRIMADLCADGVWSASSYIPDSTMEGLRVSEALWARIQDWQAWHDSQIRCGGKDPDFDLVGFVREGYAQARAVKAELPDWIVLYADEILLNQALDNEITGTSWTVEIT